MGCIIQGVEYMLCKHEVESSSLSTSKMKLTIISYISVLNDPLVNYPTPTDIKKIEEPEIKSSVEPCSGSKTESSVTPGTESSVTPETEISAELCSDSSTEELLSSVSSGDLVDLKISKGTGTHLVDVSIQVLNEPAVPAVLEAVSTGL